MRARKLLVVMLFAAMPGCNRVPARTPQDFAFVFNYSLNDDFSLNTFNGTFQRSTTSAGDTIIPFQLTTLQRDSVYAFMRGIDFFSLPEYLEPELHVMVFPSPWCSYTVRAAGIVRHVSAGGSFTTGVLAVENLKRLNDLLIAMVRNSPDYQRLPQRSDGLVQSIRVHALRP